MAWFGKPKPKQDAPPVERMELRLYFFGTGVLLVALTYWMLYDEARPRRPWKDYQVRFNALEYRMVQDELAAAQRELTAKEPEVKALEAELKAAEAATSGPEMERLLKEKATLEAQLRPLSEKVAFTKATLDEAYYFEEKALYEKGGNRETLEYKKAREEAKRIEGELAAAQRAEGPISQRLETLEAELQKRNETVQKVRDKLAELRTPVLNLERRLVGIRGRSPEIHQVIIEGLDINEFKQPTLRVDRCTTCHVGAVRPGFEKEKLEKYGVSPSDLKVFMSHPYREVLIGKHPTNQYGCTSCHRGQPPVLEADEAHSVIPRKPPALPAGGTGKAEAGETAQGEMGKSAKGAEGGGPGAEMKAERATPGGPKPEAAVGHDLSEKHFYWERPLLLGEMVQASCRRCHADQDAIPLAPVYSAGRAMVADLGCFGCHNIRGFEKAERVAPDLTKVRSKVDPGWLVRWIQNPKQYLPKTKMPVFKNGPGEDPRDFMTAEQVTGIAAYLWKASAEDPEQRGAYKGGDAEKGKTLVRNVGCLGCHVVKGLEPPAQAAQQAGAEGKPEAEEKKEGAAAPPVDAQAVAARVAAWAAVKPSPPPGHDFAPDLTNIAEKVNPEWLYRWLLNPKRYNPATKMPNLRLSPEDAGHIAAFLMTQGRKRPQPPALLEEFRKESVIKEGERLIRKRGCFGCHNIVGFEVAEKIAPDLTNYGTKRLLELFFGEAVHIKQNWEDFTLNKLLNPQIYATERVEQIMPNFRFSLEQAKALRVFLKAQNDDRAPRPMTRVLTDADVALQDGRRQVRRYNCDGCHVLENQGGGIAAHYEQINLAPPPLVVGNLQEGEKVQSTWLYEWLARPTSVRPWLQVRMPTFGLNIDEATGFARYFGALAKVRLPYEFVLAEEISSEYLRAGRQLASKDYFDCFSCHVQGTKNPEGPPAGWAPDLALARYRLRPVWIEKWLRDPQKIQPGTKMPSFFTDTEGIPDDILKDPKDPDKKKQLDRQVRALVDYVMSLGDVAQRR